MINVIVVDDERQLREMIEAMLKHFFPNTFNCLPAQDAGEALELLGAHQGAGGISLMIIGNQMPGNMSGVELVEKIKTEHPSIRLILTSGSHIETHKADRFLLGMETIKNLPRFVSELLNITPTPP